MGAIVLGKDDCTLGAKRERSGALPRAACCGRGTALIAIGLMLLACAAGLTIYNLYDQNRAARESEEAARSLVNELPSARDDADVPAYVLNPEMEMPVKTIGKWDYVAVLSVPSQNLELPVIDSWSYSALRVAPCKYAGSAYSNDLVIAAHNYPSHFGGLKSIAVGEKIFLQDMAGNTFAYQVAAYEVLKPSDVEGMISTGWDLTLFTCTIGGQNRQALRCELVDSKDLLL